MSHMNAKSENFTLVVIPYCGEKAQGHELQLALLGWKKYCRFNHKIVVIGEGMPYELEGSDVIFIHSKRVQPRMGMYRQHLDYVSCFRKVHELFPSHEGFIFAADDNYPVNDFTLEDIMVPKITSNEIKYDSNAAPFTWSTDQNRTFDLLSFLKAEKKNFTTHFPCFFEFDKLFSLYDRFDMDRNSYVVENLYFNLYKPSEEPLLLDNGTDSYRYFITDKAQVTPQNISNAFSKKKFICNAEKGWSLTLEGFLMQHYL